MKKVLFLIFLLPFGLSAIAQQSIQFRSVDKAECVKSDMTSLKASFSFSTIEAQDYESERGTFSWLSLPNTVIGGNEGDPQIPVVNELIAVPFGATPRIEITSYSSTDYRLADYDMKTLVPRQPSIRKDQRPEDVPFIMNEAAYQTRGLRSEPTASIDVVGTMRGIRLGKLGIEPVSYDPVNNKIRVFNDIEVTVHFDGADAQVTEQMLVDTYSPYFEGIYDMMFNGRSIRSAYDDHPDLYTTPVKMLVVTTSTYTNSTPFQNWLNWKKQKGIDVDVQTVTSSTSSADVRSLIQSRYNANHPTFLVIVGDETAVKYYTTYTVSGLNYNPYCSDLQYASIDDDVYHDMFMSRMSVSSTTELGYLVDKILMYEQYTMPDPSYLSNVLLIAGADGTWAPKVGRPTINYAADNYFNTAHGFSNVYKYVTDTYTGCYDYLSSGVGFANYTAHGDIQEWYSPNFTNSNVNSLTNTNKYFWAMGNCCLTCNFGNSSYSPCYGEAMIRAQNKGAFGYIGSVPESYWWEDYYFGVGATSVYSQTPTMSQTTTGVYDFMFDDTQMNTLNSVPFAGNVAVTYAHAGSYSYSVSDEYYWRAYQCFGDGSVMPYHTQPAANSVSHASTINIGATSFPVSAVAGSYVSITKNNEILGVAEVPSNGTVNVPISGLTSAGDVMIVVTRQQRQPYIQTIQAISVNGPYISLDSYTPNIALVGENTDLSLTFKNVGNAATSGTTTVTLTAGSDVTIDVNTKTFSSLAANATTTVSGFRFHINSGVTLGSNVTLHYSAVNGSNTWEGDLSVTANQIFTVSVAANNANYGSVSGGGQFNYNQSCTVNATPADGYMFTSWTQDGNIVSTNAEYTFNVTDNTNLVANFASGVAIGSGTETNEYLPTYNYYKYSLTEQIYTAAELGAPGAITSIAFYNGGAEKTRTLDFYLATTTKSSFSSKTDWITVSNSDKVFSGSVTMVANDWTTITFNTPFNYDGTSNLVLVTDDNTGEYTYSPHMACRVFNANGNQTIYIYSDGTNYNPSSPTTSQSSNYDVLSVKNQLILTKEASVEFYNITAIANPSEGGSVTIESRGNTDKFQVELTEDFENWANTPYNWQNDASYPWTVVSEGQDESFALKSGNAGVASSTSTIEVTVDIPVNGQFSFDLWSRGESTNDSQDWDVSRFFIDGQQMFQYGQHSGWESYSTDITAGSHTFKWTYKKDSSVDPTGDCFIIDNIVFVSGESSDVANGSFYEGQSCTVTAIPNTGYNFVNWTENGTAVSTNASYTFTVTGNRELMANFSQTAQMFTITATANPTNGGTVRGGGSFAEGQTCTLIATPATGYTFTNWTKDGSQVSTDANFTITVTEDANYVANFTLNSYAITASVNPANAGTITGAGTYNHGATATLTATPNTGYTFTNWTMNGTQVSTNATYSFNVTAAATLVANFTPLSYVVTATPDPVEGGTVAFGGRGNRDELVYDFEDGWQGWTTFQGSTTSPNSWMHNTAYPTSNNDFSTGYGYNSSDGFMLSESYISGSSSGSGTAVTPDNYLVSPQVRLGGSISFYAGGRNTSYCAEVFSVMVSTTDNTNATSFTTVGTWTLSLDAAGYNSTPYSVDLSAYSGMGYIAIRHHDCYDQWFLAVDNITIVEGEVDDGSISATYEEGQSCTLIATPNTGYSFVNWTENGTAVSTNANYSFTVTGNRDLVANFSQGLPTYTITATANPTAGGTVTGAGSYTQGQTCTLTATANTGYTFTNWTKNGSVVSNNATYSFTVSQAGAYVANFTLNSYQITVSADPTSAGTVSGGGTYNHGASATLTATPANGFDFVNWTKNGSEVSTNATYNFIVTEGGAYVAHFTQSLEEQTVTLPIGWSWWSTNVEITLQQLENALGTNGASIVSQNGSESYLAGYGWDGNIGELDLSQMYELNMTGSIELTVSSVLADPADHPITLNPNGYTWIGYPVQQSMNVGVALTNLNAEIGDLIKSKSSLAMYTGDNWVGTLNSLEPGQGYMYKSTASTTKTFTYSSNKGGEVKANITGEGNYWTIDHSRFANNMNVLAVVEMDGTEAFNDNIEVGAFVGDECRGSVRLMRVENMGRYMAFLTIHGETGEPVSFRVLDDSGEREVMETIDLRINTVVGDLEKPYVLHVGGNSMVLFPNPVTKGQAFRLEMPSDSDLNGAKVEVFNALGNLVRTETLTGKDASIVGMKTAGVYTVKVTDRNGNVNFSKLVVK